MSKKKKKDKSFNLVMTREDFDDVVDSLFGRRANIPDEVINTYKNQLYDTVKALETDVISEYTTAENVKNVVLEYLNKLDFSKGIFNTGNFTVVSVPIIMPLEFASMLVFFKSLLIFVLMQVVDDVISNGFSGMKDVAEMLVKSTSDINLEGCKKILNDLKVPSNCKKEDLN
jgi:hypothetical protein